VQEGGLLSHAAVMARELGIPAVIGCRGAMNLIGDGGVIDVDADAGEVRLVAGA
jgi:pyruvate,water dikinase